MPFYHYTGIEFSKGDILRPQPHGYCHWPENRAMESILEVFRPTHCLPRKESVFLTKEKCNGEKFGAESARYELEVEADTLCEYQRSDLQWLIPIDQEYSSVSDIADYFTWPELRDIAMGYWGGDAYNLSPKFEYRSRLATIKSISEAELL